MPARLKNGKREQDARRAFTLIEVMVALAITAIMVIGITSVLTFNFIYEDVQELRANAMDALAREMERARRQFIFKVEPYTVMVADNRTPNNPYDDTTGTLTVRLYDRNGNLLTAAPTGKDRLRVVMTVEWHGRGRLSPRIYREQLVGYLIP